MAETTCPVFRPTEREFKNFREYLSKIDPIAGPVGLCKIIPPPGWAARRRSATEQLMKSVKIPTPIRQCISGAKGVYSVDVLEGAPMTLAEFKAYADVRAPFPSSTADAGSITSAAGVRRGRSSSTPILSSLQEPQGNPATKTGKDWAVHRHGGGGRGGEGGEVERRVRMFWKSLGPNVEPPMYGADTLGTLFHPDDHDAWNVGRLVRGCFVGGVAVHPS